MSSRDEKPTRQQIAVGVVLDRARGRVLLSRRPAHLPHGGLWEFPGGKQEPGETIEEALRRELLEELDLRVVAARSFLRVRHDYPGHLVELHVWLVEHWAGQPRGMHGQQHEWVPIAALHERAFPEANRRIVTSLQLPQLYLITPDLSRYDEKFFAATESLLAAGVRLLQFRCQRLSGGDRLHVLQTLTGLCRKAGARLLVNGTVDEVRACGAHGIHLRAAHLTALIRRPLPAPFLVGASCHDEAELHHAEQIGADFAVLGPVARTRSHAVTAPLGWAAFAQLVGSGRQIPVYAVGGLDPGSLLTAHQAGAWGIAMISAVWSAPDPAQAAAACTGSMTGPRR